MIINGFEGVSLIDYPGKICSIVYTSPCNFRCPFCHNPSLVTDNAKTLNEAGILEDIFSRSGFIDAVTVTGGEPALQPDLPEFFSKIKSAGLLAKLDTNGYLFEPVERLVREGLVDYIAMDIKTAPSKYARVTGRNDAWQKVEKTLKLVMKSGIDYCFRTTAVPGLVDAADFREIAGIIRGAKLYVIQQFENDITLDKSMKKTGPYTEREIEEFFAIVKKDVKSVKQANMPLAV